MLAAQFRRRCYLAFLLCVVAASICAQPAKKEFEPQIGQDGKDVIWVPTPQGLIEKMLDMAKVTSADTVIDLGSGDGRTVIAAAKRGAKALGVEYNPDMVELSRRNAEQAGVAGKANFIKADLFETDLSQATVITMYLLPTINIKLRPKILDLKPGTRIVSHQFTMDDWDAEETDSIDGRTAYMWIVPAKVEGLWQFAQGELSFVQSFQTVTGSLRGGGNTVAITNGRLRGYQIFFTAGNTEYTGRINGAGIEGTMRGQSSGAWSATRANARLAAPK